MTILKTFSDLWFERHRIDHGVMTGSSGINFDLDKAGRVRAFFDSIFAAAIARDITWGVFTTGTLEIILDSEQSALRSLVNNSGPAVEIIHYVTVIMSK